MVCFLDGVAVDRVVGFEDMGNKDDFPTLALARRLIRSGVMAPKNKGESGRINLKKKGKKQEDYDSGDDF